jgi:hypothetical protein
MDQQQIVRVVSSDQTPSSLLPSGWMFVAMSPQLYAALGSVCER